MIMANSLDPDEMAHYEPSHLDIRFAQGFVLVCWAEKVNSIFHGMKLKHI